MSTPAILVDCEFVDTDDDTTEYETYEEETRDSGSMDQIKDQLDDLSSMLDNLSVAKQKLKDDIAVEKMHNDSLQQDNAILNENLGAPSGSLFSDDAGSDSTTGTSCSGRKRDRTSRHRPSLSCSDLSSVTDRLPQLKKYSSRKTNSFYGMAPSSLGGSSNGSHSGSDECVPLHKTCPPRFPSGKKATAGPFSLNGITLPPAQYARLSITVDSSNLDDEENDSVLDLDEQPVYRSVAPTFANASKSQSLPCSPFGKGFKLDGAAFSNAIFDLKNASTADFLMGQLRDIQQKVKNEIAEKERLEKELWRVRRERKSLEEMNESLRTIVKETMEDSKEGMGKKLKHVGRIDGGSNSSSK